LVVLSLELSFCHKIVYQYDFLTIQSVLKVYPLEVFH